MACAVFGQKSDFLERRDTYLADSTDSADEYPGFHLIAPWVFLTLGIACNSCGRPGDSRRAFAESRKRFSGAAHHALEAIALLIESADVASTVAISDPGYRRQLASEGEAALRRAGGALRSGLSPRIAWLRCMVLDGQWQEAAGILEQSPTPGNAYLWRDVRYATAALACYRGDPQTAWEQVRQIHPGGADNPPGDVILREGLQLQRLAAELCINAGDLAGATSLADRP